MTALLTDAPRPSVFDFVLAGVNADICGHVHVRFCDKAGRICYLKVQNSYRGCGPGKMLVQAAIGKQAADLPSMPKGSGYSKPQKVGNPIQDN